MPVTTVSKPNTKKLKKPSENKFKTSKESRTSATSNQQHKSKPTSHSSDVNPDSKRKHSSQEGDGHSLKGADKRPSNRVAKPYSENPHKNIKSHSNVDQAEAKQSSSKLSLQSSKDPKTKLRVSATNKPQSLTHNKENRKTKESRIDRKSVGKTEVKKAQESKEKLSYKRSEGQRIKSPRSIEKWKESADHSHIKGKDDQFVPSKDFERIPSPKPESLLEAQIIEEYNECLPILSNAEPQDNSLETLESGISLTSPQDLSDGEVEESISSRFVEVDEMELADDPSPPSSTIPPNLSLPIPEVPTYDEAYENIYCDDFEEYESDFEDGVEDDDDESSLEDTDDESDKDQDEDDNGMEDKIPSKDEIGGHTHSEYLNKNDKMEKVFVTEANLSKETTKSDYIISINGSNLMKRDHMLSETSKQFEQERPSQPCPKTSKIVVNFERAKERKKSEKTSQRLKNRGEQLLEMIQLDSISIDLFIQIPDSYEAYISTFGHSNSVQVSVQTNDDALSEAVQTEYPPLLNKWTQKPIHFVMRDGELPTPQDYLGVGGDKQLIEDENYSTYLSVISHTGRLSKFLSSASQVILSLLEEESIFAKEEIPKERLITESLGFLPSSVQLGSGILPIVDSRPVTLVSFCSFDPSIFVTGHGILSEAKDSNAESSALLFNDVSLLCLWSVHQPSTPQAILSIRSSPNAICFRPGKPVVIIAGLSDGSLAAWDLREAATTHPTIVSVGKINWRLRPPSFITACSEDDVLEGSEIVGLQMLDNSDESINLQVSDTNQLFVATSNGSVLHCSRHGIKIRPSIFTAEIDPGPAAVSISVCPHDPQYFLVGGSDGIIRLHSTTFSEPLTCWQASSNPYPVKKVKWSPSRPCVFYMLDSEGVFHIWDLSAGDIFPIISVEDNRLTGDTLVTFDLAKSALSFKDPQVPTVFADKNGAVILRMISPHYLSMNVEDYRSELERFKCYVSIISNV